LIGVNFMDKTILIRNTEITFSIWDLGGKNRLLLLLLLLLLLTSILCGLYG
jgi:GTP-binding protein of the ras superfamily involved in termination of M-phase